MDKIAVFMGNNNETISFSESGSLKVFLKKEGGWQVVQELLLSINPVIGIKNAREKLMEIVSVLDDCKIIVGKKVEGIAYNVFETMQFTIWEFEGHPQNFLDYIIEKEHEIQEAEQQEHTKKPNYIEMISEAHYVIDLEKVQSMNSSVSSKQVIIPILEKGAFKKLDIICTHIPPWIENQIEKYALKMETESLCSGSYKIMLLDRGLYQEVEGRE